MNFKKIDLDSGNRMLRAGFGKNNGVWFARVDLWAWGFRVSGGPKEERNKASSPVVGGRSDFAPSAATVQHTDGFIDGMLVASMLNTGNSSAHATQAASAATTAAEPSRSWDLPGETFGSLLSGAGDAISSAGEAIGDVVTSIVD